MRLERPFYQLPILFDAARLQREVAALAPEAWAPHPDRVAGNSAARLITAHGEENDGVYGQMLPTRWLAQMPYTRQVLASFGVVWSRSRLMRLAPGAEVPEHADINYHWHTRVRMHVPVFTREEVRFHCDGESVHMAAGEAWIFDNWRRHHVENPSPAERIHLVADTTGTSAFWTFACAPPPPREQWRKLPFRPEANPRLLTEMSLRPAIMPPAEVHWLIDDWIAELVALSPEHEPQVAAATRHMRSFVRDWRQLCAMHGDNPRARPAFAGMSRDCEQAAAPLTQGLVMRTNSADAMLVLQKRVLHHLVAEQ
tara:strand:+ start:7620 stop:8555 length:936 start_codon:yes stop_codon:yes gene_type:complete